MKQDEKKPSKSKEKRLCTKKWAPKENLSDTHITNSTNEIHDNDWTNQFSWKIYTACIAAETTKLFRLLAAFATLNNWWICALWLYVVCWSLVADKLLVAAHTHILCLQYTREMITKTHNKFSTKVFMEHWTARTVISSSRSGQYLAA